MKKYFLLGLCLITTTLSAQTNESSANSNKKKVEIGGQLLGPTKVISAFFDYYLNDKINVELGSGIAGFYTGINYFFLDIKRSNWSPYLGAYFSRAETITGSCNCPSGLNPTAMRSGIYIPLGIRYLSVNGFVFSPEISAFYKFNAKYSLTAWGAIKIGCRF